MRKYITVSLMLIMLTAQTFAQKNGRNSYKNTKDWAMSLQGGALQPIGSFSNLYKTSATIGAEISYDLSKSVTVFINGEFDFMAAKDTGGLSATYIETIIGARKYFGKKTTKFFAEADAGDYISSYNTDDGNGGITTITNNNFGVSLGPGIEFSGNGFSAFYIKAKYHLVIRSSERSSFLGIYAGVRIYP